MTKVLKISEAAERLGVAHETARRWAVSGFIPAFRYDDSGHWRIAEEDLDAWIKERQPPASDAGQGEASGQ